MKTWLILLLLFISLIIFIILIIFVDWIFKCKKTARENKLNFYAVGYAVLLGYENGKAILIIDGLLGANLNELVFGNRFKDDAIYLKEKLSNIRCFKTSEYNENDFLSYIYKNRAAEDVKSKYVVRNMAGISISKSIPKLIKTRMFCKFDFDNGVDFYFCYKNTTRNVKAINNFKNYTDTL